MLPNRAPTDSREPALAQFSARSSFFASDHRASAYSIRGRCDALNDLDQEMTLIVRAGHRVLPG
jgi:hypothetical protein